MGGETFVGELQRILSHRERKMIRYPSFPRAGVLVPLFHKKEECHILFTKRTHLVKYHKGEISFPGGAFDTEDGDLRRTALREAHEEIGLREEEVDILGVLDDIVTVTEFIVTPFVGYFPYPYRFSLSPAEIEELIEVPLAFLLDETCFSQREIIQDEGKRIVDAYQYRDHVIWGATAKILKQLLDLIRDPELTEKI